MMTITCNDQVLSLASDVVAKMTILMAAIGEKTRIYSYRSNTVVALAGGKSNPFKGRITKQSVVTCRSNANYEKTVRAHQVHDGLVPDFVAEESKIGAPVLVDGCKSPFLYNSNTSLVYLETFTNKSVKSVYFLDGVETKKDPAWNFPKVYAPSQGGITNTIAPRTLKLESILAIRANKIEVTF
jgi:ABC-type Fe3+/spermidine/putrescine transport system ATPase subunit